MAFEKGHTKKGGRKKGTKNKATTDLKQMVLAALEKAGGEKYLVEQAKEKPAIFLQLLARILPIQAAQPPEDTKPTVREEFL